jgi:hypothetical protein
VRAWQAHNHARKPLSAAHTVQKNSRDRPPMIRPLPPLSLPSPPAKRNQGVPMAADSSRVLSSVRQTLRRKHYACRTEEAYLQWFRRFIRFHQFRQPANMDEPETEAFLTHLAVQKNVASSAHTVPAHAERPRPGPLSKSGAHDGRAVSLGLWPAALTPLAGLRQRTARCRVAAREPGTIPETASPAPMGSRCR